MKLQTVRSVHGSRIEMEKQSLGERIAYIVPSESMKEYIEDILAEEIREGVIEVMMIDITRPGEEYHRLCGEGYGCIIARGGTYSSLVDCVDKIPVVEERIRTADIVETIAGSTPDPDRPSYVVLHKNNADEVENLTQLSGGKIHVLRYIDYEHIKEVMATIDESGVRVFSSGYAKELSGRDDLDFVVIRNRPHTVRETVGTARTFIQQMQENIQQVNTLDSIFNNIDEGLIIFDTEESVTECNERAASLMSMSRTAVIGRQVSELVKEMPAKRKDGSCSMESPRNFMGRMGKAQISYTVFPFDFYRGETRYMMTLHDVTKIQSLERNIRVQLSKKGLVAEHSFEDILTCEPVMEHVIDKARTVAGYEGSVLIYGESGTGKELFAQSIHNASERRNGPFVAVNCSALTESLLESELFGYVGGSFTGARKEGKAGLFELAHNGTIFLDEINSTPLSLQTKILRVIESQQVMRVGSDYVIPLDVRVISASNGDLDKDIREGRFRRDLYYRLNTFEITVPPVRDRKEDILLLFRYYVSKFSDIKAPESAAEIPAELEKQLLSHDWLGNVREIRSAALRYNAFGGDNSAGDIIKEPASDIVNKDTAAKTADMEPGTQHEDMDIIDGETVHLSELSNVVERLVIKSLEGKGLSKTEIAKALGISRQALYKKINKE